MKSIEIKYKFFKNYIYSLLKTKNRKYVQRLLQSKT